jgi:hypothetical protein
MIFTKLFMINNINLESSNFSIKRVIKFDKSFSTLQRKIKEEKLKKLRLLIENLINPS